MRIKSSILNENDISIGVCGKISGEKNDDQIRERIYDSEQKVLNA